MIKVEHLTKRFGAKLAVDDLSFDVRPGVVTGFLGPNGSGKSTTMRCMLDLDRPESGNTTFNGQRFRDLDQPLHRVGALLDAGYVHPGRSARNHLRWLAASNGLSMSRVGEVLGMVGLDTVARSKVRSFSLGMKQRLGLASVLLGDPEVIILDEPANGLDPEGIRWIRQMLTYLASQGRAVLVSSHQLSEMSMMADDLVVIGQGHLIDQCTVDSFVQRFADQWVTVQSPSAQQLGGMLADGGAALTWNGPNEFQARGVDRVAVGELAARHQMVLHELSSQTGSLEDAFLKATAEAQEYRSGVQTSTEGSAQ